MHENSQLLSKFIGITYPLIILFSFYIIINGHNSPGGGFQGGAILSSIFIIQYIINPEKEISLYTFQLIEKILFMCILLLPILLIFFLNGSSNTILNQLYLITMNVLIAIKVCCGLSIIFFRFVLFESR